MDPYIGEIRLFAGNYAPTDWAFCNGQLLPISSNTILFSILGNRFGGDGVSTFGLPNLSGKAPLGMGQGPGLSNHNLATSDGSSTVTLVQSEMPVHTHAPRAYADNGNSNSPAGGEWAQYVDTSTRPPTSAMLYSDGTSGAVQMNPLALGVAGSSMPHNNMQPFLAMNFIICLNGIFPQKP
ncbi:tail fiber protein [Massilia solisilvae]|uniref:Tail fiber protein n=1 Tax=Massilia solisilvae TaxID=1811225 RepID=A0ABT2BPQ6_9BURK|nr:tail fiber protein [Massilia solisilvae]MCS0609858.1 tail fiber protein [Massilia solisilvae]